MALKNFLRKFISIFLRIFYYETMEMSRLIGLIGVIGRNLLYPPRFFPFF